jgi:hypothetical protein
MSVVIDAALNERARNGDRRCRVGRMGGGVICSTAQPNVRARP